LTSGNITYHTVDTGDAEGTYASIGVDTDGTLVAAYDLSLGAGDLYQCAATFSGANWNGCHPVPVSFNTHSNVVLPLAGGDDVAFVYSDATTESPTLFIGPIAGGSGTSLVGTEQHLDAAADSTTFTTAALFTSTRLGVAYARDLGDGGEARLAIVEY
jgi:hypothetical protein